MCEITAREIVVDAGDGIDDWLAMKFVGALIITSLLIIPAALRVALPARRNRWLVSLFWWGGGSNWRFNLFRILRYAGWSAVVLCAALLFILSMMKKQASNLSLNTFVGCGASALSDLRLLSLAGLIRREQCRIRHTASADAARATNPTYGISGGVMPKDSTPASSPYAHAVYAAKSLANQIRFQHILNGFTFFANGCPRLSRPTGPPKNLSITASNNCGPYNRNLQHRHSTYPTPEHDICRDGAIVLHFGEITHSTRRRLAMRGVPRARRATSSAPHHSSQAP